MEAFAEKHVLKLAKDGQLYVFRYSAGHELEVLDEIDRMCRDPSSGLAWSDAAILSLQIPDPSVREAQ